MNSELTTNMPDSQSSNPIQPFDNDTKSTTLTIDSAQQNQFTTFPNNNVELLDCLSEFITTNNSFITNSIIAIMEEMLFDVNESAISDMVSAETVIELTTGVVITEINIAQTNAVDATAESDTEIYHDKVCI